MLFTELKKDDVVNICLPCTQGEIFRAVVTKVVEMDWEDEDEDQTVLISYIRLDSDKQGECSVFWVKGYVEPDIPEGAPNLTSEGDGRILEPSEETP